MIRRWLFLLIVTLALFAALSIPAAQDGAPDSMALPPVTVVAHNLELTDGYFDLVRDYQAQPRRSQVVVSNEPLLSLVARPGSDLHRWLASHRGEQIVITFREWRHVK